MNVNNLPKININSTSQNFDAVKAIKEFEKQVEIISKQTTSGITSEMISNGVLSGTISSSESSNLSNQIEQINKYNIYVGIPDSNNSRPKQGITNSQLLYILSNGVTKNAARSMIEKYMRERSIGYSKARQMVWQLWLREHGSPAYRIPPRPLIEPALMAYKEQISNYMLKAVKSYLTGDKDLFKERLIKVGKFARRVVRRIWFDDPRNNWPPNAESTIKAKGSDHPMIDTSELRQSITYVVDFPNEVNNGPKSGSTEEKLKFN